MTDTLAHDWNIPSSKTIDGEVYRIHASGRKDPYGYFSEREAENAAKRLDLSGIRRALFQ